MTNQNNPLRLTIIISTPVSSIETGVFFYDEIKKFISIYPGMSITGNITTIIDPCCGKAQNASPKPT